MQCEIRQMANVSSQISKTEPNKLRHDTKKIPIPLRHCPGPKQDRALPFLYEYNVIKLKCMSSYGFVLDIITNYLNLSRRHKEMERNMQKGTYVLLMYGYAEAKGNFCATTHEDTSK